MSPPPCPGADRTLPLADALARSEPLGALLRRLQDSQARWAAARDALPPSLAALVRPGPLDDESWTLLAPSGAAAAKLRQCLPQVQAALDARGLPPRALRVKVRTGG
ncbi:MAG: DUF721 domain-containing protein [Burkholderiaceae bacterium]|jgi:hypothetical protein|nr:DUF721 domain-containing protein [Burkholderiaceae bacterium]HMQ71576.1 DciA family protein [Rubrivivax sp.]